MGPEGTEGAGAELRERATTSRPPATVIAFVALVALLDLAQILASFRETLDFPLDGRPSLVFVNLFRFGFPLLFLFVVAVGLWNRLRWVWVAALAWQVLIVTQGTFNIWINEYDASYITRFTQIGFWHGALPIAAGLLGLILLLWPSTRRWIRN